MPHLPLPPSPSPPPPPPPPLPDVQAYSDEIEATFGLAVASIIMLVVIGICLVGILGKLSTMYSPVASKAVESTPTTGDAITTSTKPSTVEMGEPAMPLHAKLAHVLAVIVSGVIALFVGIVLADGTSVIKLKEAKDLPTITVDTYWEQGLKYRADELLGPTYGVGLHHDQAGFTWTDVHAGKTLRELIRDLGTPAVIAAVPSVISTDDLKHPVPFLECDDLQTAGLAAVSFGFIAEVVAGLMIIFHSLALTGLLSSGITKPVSALVWLTLTAGFLVVVGLAVGVYTATWECNNDFIPTLKLEDHFEYNYGFVFAILGYISAALIFFVVLFVHSTKDTTSEAPPMPSPFAMLAQVVCGVVGAAVICGVVVLSVLGGNNAFDSDPPVDPNFNPCHGQRPYNLGPGDGYFYNTACMVDSVTQTLEQAGGNVTPGYVGGFDAADRVPIVEDYDEAGLCPVNVHWHLGAEHLSVGEYDEYGSGPGNESHRRRQLAPGARLGGRCHYYDSHDAKFTTEYNWQHCTDMHVGETYEIHWPHSAAGACGTRWQYQTPFYDGVFCRDGIITVAPLNTYQKIGVQAQIFTVVNDEAYYVDNLIDGMIRSGSGYGVGGQTAMGEDIAKYTGSTTGTTRNNQVCSRYTPITWQVDRKCHMVSASSFDKLCLDMMAMADDMSGDIYPHGSREVVAPHLTANNQQTRK